LLWILYKILSNTFFSGLSLYVDEITGDHQSEFWCNRPTTDKIFLHSSDTGEKWEYNETVHQLFIHFKKAHDSV
jgi:hypothetical protein